MERLNPDILLLQQKKNIVQKEIVSAVERGDRAAVVESWGEIMAALYRKQADILGVSQTQERKQSQ